MTPHAFLYEIAVEAVFQKDRRLLGQALMADPLTGAILTPERMDAMLNELCNANQRYMADWH